MPLGKTKPLTESPATSAMIMSQMEEALIRLQKLPRTPENYERAHGIAFSSGNVLRPATSRSAAEWFHGRALAVQIWVDGQRAAFYLAHPETKR